MSASAFTPTVLTISSGTGSGSGEKNYITNPSMASATTGWNVVGDFTLTRTTAASELPREYTTGTGIKLVATSGTQSTADYMYFDFNLDDVDLNRKLKIQWSQKDVGTYAAGQLAVIITSQADRTTALHTPVTTAIPAVDGDFVTSFDSGSTAALSLVIRATTDMTTGDGIVISDVIVGPGEIVQGAVVSEWQSYTPTLSNSTNVSTNVGKYRRIGDSIQVNTSHVWNGAGAGSTFTVSLPSGLTFDTTKIANTGGGNQALGVARWFDSGVANYVGVVCYDSATAVRIFNHGNTGSGITGTTFTSGDGLFLEFTAPIAEFSGSGTVSLGAGAQVEYAASTTGTWDAAASATNTVYGPEGAPVSGSLTSNRTKTIRFQYPIQSDDMLTLEVKLANGNWVDIANSVAVYANQNTAAYGARLQGVSGSTTDVDVSFQQFIAPGTGYGVTTGANNWGTTFVTAWRVRKAKASSPVGFGLAGTDGSAGLYKPGAAPGYTGSVAVPAGYVGEIIGTESVGTGGSGYSTGSTTAATTVAGSLISLTLNKGFYLVGAFIRQTKAANANADRVFGNIQVGGTTVHSANLIQSTSTAISGGTMSLSFSMPIKITVDATVVRFSAATVSDNATAGDNLMYAFRIF